MKSDPLHGPRLKIKWAQDALKQLESELSVALGGDCCALVEDLDAASGDRLLKVKLRNPLSEDLKRPISAAVHDLRSSLDLTVIALARAAKVSTDQLCFPFAKDAQSFAKESKRRLKGIGPQAAAKICDFHPFHGGNDLLWGLHSLFDPR